MLVNKPSLVLLAAILGISWFSGGGVTVAQDYDQQQEYSIQETSGQTSYPNNQNGYRDVQFGGQYEKPTLPPYGRPNPYPTGPYDLPPPVVVLQPRTYNEDPFERRPILGFLDNLLETKRNVLRRAANILNSFGRVNTQQASYPGYLYPGYQYPGYQYPGYHYRGY